MGDRLFEHPDKPREIGGYPVLANLPNVVAGSRMLGHRRGERRLVVGEAKTDGERIDIRGSRSCAMLASTQDESSPPESVSPTGTSAII